MAEAFAGPGAPTAGTVSDGMDPAGEELDYTASSTATISWRGFQEDCSLIMHYEVGLEQRVGGTWLNASSLVADASVRSATFQLPTGAADGTHFRARVCALNLAGHRGRA